MYPETQEGREWFELDDHTERIHGFEEKDDSSPYDGDVVDAPEDMKRVGNDHEDLHNAKLSPEGYYNGFHHKDFEGNFAQKARRSNFAQKHQRSMVQIADHDNDADDVLEEGTYVNYEHEDDTEDLSELVDPINQNYVQTKYEHEDDTEDLSELVNPINQQLLYIKMSETGHGGDTDSIPEGNAGNVIGSGTNLNQNLLFLKMQDRFNDTDDIMMEEESSEKRGTANRRMQNDEAWAKFYKAGQESLAAEADLKETDWDKANQIPDMPSTKYIQLKDHDNDTDDMSDAVDPVNIAVADETNVQTGYSHISHEADTEDIADDVNPSNYDQHHSKAWNDAVERKALELENEMKIEDNMKLSQKKAKEDAKKKASEAKAKAEAEKRKAAQSLAETQAHKTTVQTIDLSDLYKDLPNDSLIQTGASWNDNNHLYEHHSPAFYDRVDAEEKEYNFEMAQKEQEESENIYRHKTSNMEQMYDGIMLQTGYEHHSSNFYNIENQQNQEWDNIEGNYQKQLEKEDQARAALAAGTASPEQMAAATPDVHQTNPFVKDLNSLYDGIQMVQLSDHVNDQDDLVPEFSAEIVPQSAHVVAEEKHFDFEGKEYKETFDE